MPYTVLLLTMKPKRVNVLERPTTPAAPIPRRGSARFLAEKADSLPVLPAFVWTLLASIVYLTFTVFLTWPLVIHPGSWMFAAPGGDLTGGIAQLQALIDGEHNPFLPGRVTAFSTPDGTPITWALNIATLPSVLSLYALASVFGAAAAFAVFTIVGFVASGVAMFLLLRKLTGSVGLALVLGWAFAFFPFPVAHGHNPQFIHTWLFVLLVWRVLKVAEMPTVRNGLLAGGAAVLTSWWTVYFILLGGVCYVVLSVALLAFGPRPDSFGRRLGAHAAGLGVFVPFLAVLAVLASLNPLATGSHVSDLTELYIFAARPLEYLAPTGDNPLFGRWTESYVASRTPLYVGLSLLGPAVVALLLAFRRRLGGLNSVVGSFAVLALTAFLFTLRPTISILGHEVWTPSYLTYQISPTWRIYARFVILAMLALCVLAAIGLSSVSKRSRRLRLGVIVVAAIFVPVDLWAKPKTASWLITVPDIYSALRSQPPGGVAEYPIRQVDFSLYADVLAQHYHKRPILGGFARGSIGHQRALRLGRLDDPETAGRLRTLGIRYVVVPKVRNGVPNAYGAGGTYVEPGQPSTGFRLLSQDTGWRLYRITGAPTAFVTPFTGFLNAPDIYDSPNEHWWISERVAQLELYVGCMYCRGRLSLELQSLGVPRRVTISNGSARLVSADVGTAPTSVSFSVSVRGRVVLSITSEPGPSSVLTSAVVPSQARERQALFARGASQASVLVQGARFAR